MPQSGASHDASTDYYAVLEITPDATGEASTPRQECDRDSIRNHTEQLCTRFCGKHFQESRGKETRTFSIPSTGSEWFLAYFGANILHR